MVDWGYEALAPHTQDFHYRHSQMNIKHLLRSLFCLLELFLLMIIAKLSIIRIQKSLDRTL